MAKSKKIDKKVVAKKAKPVASKAAKPAVKLNKVSAKPAVAKHVGKTPNKTLAKTDAKPVFKVAGKALKAPAAKTSSVKTPTVKTPTVKTPTAKLTPVKAAVKTTAKSTTLKQPTIKQSSPKPVIKAAAAKKTEKEAKSLKEDKKVPSKKAPPIIAAQVAEKDPKAALKAKGKEKPVKAKKAKEEEEDDFVDPFDLIDGDDELAGIEIEAYLDTETTEEFNLSITSEEIVEEEVFLTDADGNRLCKVKDCDDVATTDGHCRYHYLLFWRKIQLRRKILAGGKLDRYIEELTSRYPDKYLEVLRKDLATEKNFLAALSELEIEDAGDSDLPDESEDLIEEVRGTVSHNGTSDDDNF